MLRREAALFRAGDFDEIAENPTSCLLIKAIDCSLAVCTSSLKCHVKPSQSVEYLPAAQTTPDGRANAS